jgi:hypothetical protein
MTLVREPGARESDDRGNAASEHASTGAKGCLTRFTTGTLSAVIGQRADPSVLSQAGGDWATAVGNAVLHRLFLVQRALDGKERL